MVWMNKDWLKERAKQDAKIKRDALGLRDKARRKWNEYLMTLYDLTTMSESEIYLLRVYGATPKVIFKGSLAERHKRNLKDMESWI